jgi:hypothetical protein
MIYAQIKDQKIVNIIDLQDITLVPLFLDGFDDIVRIDLLDPTPGIGWSYVNGTFTAPPDPNAVPHSVTPRQMRQALVLMGVYDQIQPAFDTLPEPIKTLATIEWEYSLAFERNRPLVSQVAAALGWTEDQLDSLWRFAGTL